ncbi:hypothetical protein PIB30_020947 [Stylosanthes scabra]|uniref:Uncharacterized protein n=1 Tax=Stylosanthes scabra TaxID=79078 RepID=A0ABU6R8Z4_9FABA|nr:hypothetical protein [Stylosanthes scabra]
METVTAIHSGAENGTVAKGNVDTDVATSLTVRTGAPEGKPRETTGSRRFSAFRSGVPLWHAKEVENSVGGSAGNGAVTRVTDGGLGARRLRHGRTPWNRDGEKKEWSRVAVEGQILLLAEAEIRRGGDSDVVPSVFDSRNGRKWGSVSLAEAVAAASTLPQASGSRCVPGMAVVRLDSAQGWGRQEVVGSLFDGVSLLLQREKKNAGRMGEGNIGLGNPDPHGPSPIHEGSLGFFACVSLSRSKLVCVMLVDGLQFFQLDPGGILFF